MLMAKTTRKDLLNAPDEFISTTRSAVKWIKENPSRFAVAVAIIVVVLASGIGFYSWKMDREYSAMLALSTSGDSYQTTLDVVQSYADTRAGKLAKLRLARMAYGEKDPKMAVDYAQDFVNDWGREDIFHWQGILIMAAAYIDRQEPDKALDLLTNAVSRSPQNFRDQALFYKGQALMALNKNAEAKEALTQISEDYHDIALPPLASLETH